MLDAEQIENWTKVKAKSPSAPTSSKVQKDQETTQSKKQSAAAQIHDESE